MSKIEKEMIGNEVRAEMFGLFYLKESGLDAEEIKENITQFTRDLLTIGAEEQEIGLTLKEVEYSEEPSEEYSDESSGSSPFPFTEGFIDCII